MQYHSFIHYHVSPCENDMINIFHVFEKFKTPTLIQNIYSKNLSKCLWKYFDIMITDTKKNSTFENFPNMEDRFQNYPILFLD